MRALAGALLVAAGCSFAGQTPVDGRAVYNFRCYFCHGYSGDAKTLAATFLNPPPANFQAAKPAEMTVARVLLALRDGRPGTAMKPFLGVISEGEMQAVAAFVVDEFVVHKAENTRYHTVENGWPNHERYAEAFPFARGEIPLSRSWESLTPDQAAGKRLFLSSCVSCHDRGAPGDDEGPAWSTRAVSYPRGGFSLATPPKVDAMTSASPYALHEIKPKLKSPTPVERRGEKLFQDNCAFCHGADGSGQNWIGKFLEPHPRNLRDPGIMATMTRGRLATAIRNGIPDTSMPAWKDVLRERDIQAIIAYIDKAFHPVQP
ncbi:MAG: c-type cytochrome [Betaproteobacteria bacterium]|nr:c-type cytochrome [Betaproteobacteria bacterium]